MTDIYFDNSATTQVSDRAARVALQAMTENYGNPSSVHSRGVAAFHALNEARTAFAGYFDGAADEIYFTSCGTESDNIVVQGAARSGGKRGRIIVSAIEHPAVYETAKSLQALGYQAEFIPVGHDGIIDLDAFASMLDAEVTLVSIMHVNNETGAIQPLREAGKIIRSKVPQALFHVDAVQSFGRLPMDVAGWQADAVSISGHKIHAPKGIGLLWLRKERNIPALIIGGGQEHGFRSGTENMSGIMAFAAAADDCYSAMHEHYEQMRQIKETLWQGIKSCVPEAVINGPMDENAVGYILNVSFPGIRSEIMLHSLEAKGICVSAGSACTSGSSKGSRILTSMHLDPAYVDSAIRFSFSRFNTSAEAEEAVRIIGETMDELALVKKLGKKSRR